MAVDLEFLFHLSDSAERIDISFLLDLIQLLYVRWSRGRMPGPRTARTLIFLSSVAVAVLAHSQETHRRSSVTIRSLETQVVLRKDGSRQ